MEDQFLDLVHLIDISDQSSFEDINGNLHLTLTVTKTGVAVYKYRLPNGKILVTRHAKLPEHLFADSVLETLKAVHVTNEHPPDKAMVLPENYKEFSVGMSKKAWVKGDSIEAEIIAVDQDTIQKIKKRDLKYVSMGFRARFVLKSGSFQGEKYDIIQADIKPNHIALLKEDPRLGKKMKIHTDSGKILDFFVDNNLEMRYDEEDLKEGNRMSAIKKLLIGYFKGKNFDKSTITDIQDIIDEAEKEEEKKSDTGTNTEEEKKKDTDQYSMEKEKEKEDQSEMEELKKDMKRMKDFMNKEGMMEKYKKDMGHHKKKTDQEEEEEKKKTDQEEEEEKKKDQEEEEEKSKDSRNYIIDLRAENKILKDKLNGVVDSVRPDEHVRFLIESREAYQSYIGDSGKVESPEFYMKSIIEKAGIFDHNEIVNANGVTGLLPFFKASMRVLDSQPFKKRNAQYTQVNNNYDPTSKHVTDKAVEEAKERVANFSFNKKDKEV